MVIPINDKWKDDSNCIGKKYRCGVNNYIDTNGVLHMETTMRLLKRKSCPGCEKCDWIEDDLEELIACGSAPIIKNISHGATYHVNIVNISRDWETGYVDDYDIEFVRTDHE